MSPQVFFQSSTRCEAFPTDGTAEGFLSSVNPHVSLQVVFVVESVPTLTTAERFPSWFHLWVLLCLTVVQFRLLAATLVSSEARQPGELLVADATAELFLSSVDGHVLSHVDLLSETLPTERAAERTLTRVKPLVCLQVDHPAKPLPALRAAEGFLSAVTGHVTQQRPLTAEGFPTLWAAERSLSGVDPHMSLQMFLSTKHLPTVRAAE